MNEKVCVLLKLETSATRPENGFNLEGLTCRVFDSTKSAQHIMWDEYECKRHPSDQAFDDDDDSAFICDAEGDETTWKIQECTIERPEAPKAPAEKKESEDKDDKPEKETPEKSEEGLLNVPDDISAAELRDAIVQCMDPEGKRSYESLCSSYSCNLDTMERVRAGKPNVYDDCILIGDLTAIFEKGSKTAMLRRNSAGTECTRLEGHRIGIDDLFEGMKEAYKLVESDSSRPDWLDAEVFILRHCLQADYGDRGWKVTSKIKSFAETMLGSLDISSLRSKSTLYLGSEVQTEYELTIERSFERTGDDYVKFTVARYKPLDKSHGNTRSMTMPFQRAKHILEGVLNHLAYWSR